MCCFCLFVLIRRQNLTMVSLWMKPFHEIEFNLFTRDFVFLKKLFEMRKVDKIIWKTSLSKVKYSLEVAKNDLKLFKNIKWSKNCEFLFSIDPMALKLLLFYCLAAFVSITVAFPQSDIVSVLIFFNIEEDFIFLFFIFVILF